MTNCPTCGQKLPGTYTDAEILRGLVHGNRPHLYAVANSDDTKLADLNRWFLTGPGDRIGYVKGPFPYDQIQRIAASGKIVPDAITDAAGRICSYRLAPGFRER